MNQFARCFSRGPAAAALVALTILGTASAVETRFWQQTDQADFEKGTLTNLSLRSDGRLFLAPDFREIFDPSTPYLWAIASDGKGTVYAGGGGSGSGTAKLFAIDSNGKGKSIAELEGLEIHALALGKDGQIYAATDPDGKVYKMSPQGKSQLFFDPKSKYIWALAFSKQGDLFVATGDHGEIFRVKPDGQSSVFFKTGETHARAMSFDGQDNLIVGTEPGGLIIRVAPTGIGFVLYQTPKREVTAVAVSKMGQIFVSAVGNRAASTPPASAPPPALTAPPPITVTAPTAAAVPARVNSSTPAAQPAAIAGGSEVYRIDPDGSPRKVWSNSQDIVYAIGFDSSDRPLIATGNRGKLYRIDSANLNTELIDASPTQITSFASGPDGRLFVSTGNIGRVYEMRSGAAAKGIFESEVLDAGSFTSWGRVAFRGTPGNVKVMTRSGNLNRPQDNWSPWAPLQLESPDSTVPCPRCLNGRIASPPARFLEYKLELAGGQAEVASVEIAYLPKNVAPVLQEVEVTPPNYKFPVPTATTASAQTLSLQPIGQKRRSSSAAAESSSSQTLTYAKGLIGARWLANDDNGDTLMYTVEIRGAGESNWKMLKDKVHEKFITWDSTAFPDGEYELRITASDSPGNPPPTALTSSLISDPFLIDNTPPQIANLAATPAGSRLEVHWKARDARSIIDHAEYSINGGDWIPVEPKSGLADAPEEDYSITLDRAGTGEQTIAVRVTDAYDNQAVGKVVVK